MRIALAVFFVCTICCPSFGDGLIRNGLGARVAGRGGSNIAWADSGTILHDNPAGMVNFQGCSLVEAGVDLLVTDLEYRDPNTVARFDNDPVPLGDFSILKKRNENLAFGVGVFSTGGFASDADMQGAPGFAGERKYKSFGAFGKILPGVSARINERLSVGATLGVAVSHIELEGPYTLQSGPLAGTPTLMDLQATGAALTWSTGLQYQLNCCTTLGLTYQSETRFRMDGSSTTIVPGVGETAFDTELHMVWPRSVGVGLRRQLQAHRAIGLDVIYYNWQQAFDHAGMFHTNATNPTFAAFGPLEEQTPLRWKDSVSIRVGYEQALANADKLRLGYVYHRNPLPVSTLTTYIAPTLEHTLSAGYGTSYRGWEIDLGYQFMFGPTQHIGTSDLIGGDFDNGELTAKAHFLYVSFLRRS